MGSKYKLIAFIQENIHAVVGQPFGCDFYDLFAGTGIVGCA
ncbi:DNA adenine methylase [Helicobacter pylori]|nr:DNA adenine methylase [Helicobacter pylori]